jgi:hypothetical protein
MKVRDRVLVNTNARTNGQLLPSPTPGRAVRRAVANPCLLIDNTIDGALPRPQNPPECHLYFAEGRHLYIALTKNGRILYIRKIHAVAE